MEETKLWIYHLLEDVRNDAIKKARGKEVTKQVYAAIIQILKLSDLARKDGILALALDDEDGNLQFEPELCSMSILRRGIGYISSGLDDTNFCFTEILVTRYWIKNPQGMEALAYYICILGLTQISIGIKTGDFSPYAQEELLTALLPEEYMAEYEREKEKRIPKQAKKTLLEKLLEKEIELSRGSIIIRNVLEEKMENVTDVIIKAGIQKLVETCENYTFTIACALRGLNKRYKEKLLSCMSQIFINVILEAEVYMGPIRMVDIDNAMVSLLEYFEETERKNMEEGRWDVC